MDSVAISRDGKTIVGAALDSQGIRSAAIWQSGTNWRTLGAPTMKPRAADSGVEMHHNPNVLRSRTLELVMLYIQPDRGIYAQGFNDVDNGGSSWRID